MDLSGIPFTFLVYFIVFAILVGLFVNFLYNTPSYQPLNEGFYGGVARGSGLPLCSRNLDEGPEILNTIQTPTNGSIVISENNPDYRELQLILSKLGCLKQDLLSPSGIVSSTRSIAFENAHDRINVGELTGMCLNQSIPSRDLDIIFATWRDRGQVLLRKLCTEAQLKEEQVIRVEKLYHQAWSDVYDIAKSRCLKTDFSKQHGGETLGDVGGYEPEHLKDARSYDYKYGGLSSSGWNGAV